MCSLYINHNHSITCWEALKYRQPFSSTKQQYLDLFEQGHSMVTAMEAYSEKMEEKYGDEVLEKRCDSAIFPTYNHIYR